MNKLFKLLKSKGFTLNGGPKSWVEHHKRGFRGIKAYTDDLAQDTVREFDLHKSLCLFSYEHFGFDTGLDRKSFIKDASVIFEDYFLGNWRIEGSKPNPRLKQTSSVFKWYNAVRNGMLIAVLAGDWDRMARVANWFEKKPKLDISGNESDEVMLELYLHILTSFRKSPLKLPSTEKMLAGAKTKRTEMLVTCWQALQNDDEVEYNKFLNAAAKLFLKSTARRFNILDWIAVPESILYQVGKHKGLSLECDQDVQAVLLDSEDWPAAPKKARRV